MFDSRQAALVQVANSCAVSAGILLSCLLQNMNNFNSLKNHYCGHTRIVTAKNAILGPKTANLAFSGP